MTTTAATPPAVPLTPCPEWCNGEHPRDAPHLDDDSISHRSDGLTLYCDLDGDNTVQLQIRQYGSLLAKDWPAAVELTVGAETRLFIPQHARRLATALLAMLDVAESTAAGVLLDESVGNLEHWLSTIGRQQDQR